MADDNAQIEALENRVMRAWVAGDAKALKGMLGRQFRLVVGASKPVLLDRKSLLDAAGGRWRIDAYRFGPVYARIADGTGIFASEVELDGAIDGAPIAGRWWMVDLWRKTGWPRKWKLLDRQLARPEGDPKLPEAVRALQLWR